MILMEKSEKVHVETYWRSANKHHEELCGDRVLLRRTEESLVAVLADGLGSGVKANILSTLTSTIIGEMLYSGLSVEDAVETILATLPVDKERDLAYSTFTIVQVFYDGRTYISQSGNPDLVMLRKGKIFHPAEETKVLFGRKVKTSFLEVYPGDCIVVCSDGIEHAGLGISNSFGWGVRNLEKFLAEQYSEDMNARVMSGMILDYAKKLYMNQPGDDSTLICLRILEPVENRILIGPPSDPAMDDEVVSALVSCKGKKICCGGSTSSMVARVTKKELRPESLADMIPGVPPKGYIDGIDLVTEGVLTLQQTDMMLRRSLEDYHFLEYLMDTQDRDGASMLSKTLLNLSEITFMIGLSNNPSHDAIAYSPISFTAKLAVIDEIMDCLKKLGKIVRVEQY